MKTELILKFILILIFALTTTIGYAKSIGKLSKYQQVTDKEIVLQTTKGYKILITAFDNHSIGVTYYPKNGYCELISPDNISEHNELNGSIYVEEIDELMQITTTTKDGLMIKVNKNNCKFTFIDKTKNTELNFDELMAGIISNDHPFSFFIDENNQLNYIAHPKL